MQQSLSQLLLSAAVVGLPLAQAIPAGDSGYEHGLEKRACAADNLIRMLNDVRYHSDAIPFCSSYLHLPTSTVVIGTVTPVVSATSYSHITATSTTTSTVGVPTTVTVVPSLAARADVPFSDKIISSYPASRISSGCSCLSIPLTQTSVLATAPAQTVIVASAVTTDTVTTTDFSTVVDATSTVPPAPTATQLVSSRGYQISNQDDASFSPLQKVMGANPHTGAVLELTPEHYLRIKTSGSDSPGTVGHEDELNLTAVILADATQPYSRILWAPRAVADANTAKYTKIQWDVGTWTPINGPFHTMYRCIKYLGGWNYAQDAFVGPAGGITPPDGYYTCESEQWQRCYYCTGTA